MHDKVFHCAIKVINVLEWMIVKLKTACIQSEYLIQAMVCIVQAVIKLFKVWQSSKIYVEI